MGIFILKERFVKNTGKKYQSYPNKILEAPSVAHLFKHIEKYIEQIPKEERYNLHYTLADCEYKEDEKRPSNMTYQDVMPIDIDGITERNAEGVALIEPYIDPVLEVLGLNQSEVGTVASGNGIHFLVGVDAFTPEQFNEMKVHYKLICSRIDTKLADRHLSGRTDNAILRPLGTLRLPQTKNVKTPDTGYSSKQSITECALINRVIIPSGKSIAELAGNEAPHGLDDDAESDLPLDYPVDGDAVLKGCLFTKWCKDNPNEVKEPQWRALLSILNRIDSSGALSHEYSKDYDGYTREETDSKIAHMQAAKTQPYNCKTVEQLWDGCSSCPYYEKCTNPIQLKRQNFIPTKENGFRNLVKDAQGNWKKGKVNYQDLYKHWENVIGGHVSTENGTVYIWETTHWKQVSDIFVRSFAQDNVDDARTVDRNEFCDLVRSSNVVDTQEFFMESVDRKINMLNGVLDFSEEEPVLLPRSKAYGFTYCLDYEYDKNAQCPRFEQFLKEVTLGDVSLQKILMEYTGYAISYGENLYAKALMLLGGGSNGKSIFGSIISSVVGDMNTSALTLSELSSEQNRMALLHSKVNIADENQNARIKDTSSFKNLVTGGQITGKEVYKKPVKFSSRAKMIFMMNELPKSNDNTHGFLRRLIIVPFNATFDDKTADKELLSKLKLEMPGILNKMIEGYARLRKQGHFSSSDLARRELDEYREISDTLYQFYKYHLEVKNNFRNGKESTAAQIYQAYKNFCEDNSIKYIISWMEMSKKLSTLIPNFKNRKHKTNSGFIYKGIRVRSTQEAEVLMHGGNEDDADQITGNIIDMPPGSRSFEPPYPQ